MAAKSDTSSVSYLLDTEGSLQSAAEQRIVAEEEAQQVVKAYIVEHKPSDKLYHGNDTIALLASMGIVATDDELRPLIAGDWTKLSVDNVMGLVSTVRQLRNLDWVTLAEGLHNSGVLNLGFADYVRYKLGYMDDDPSVVGAAQVSLQLSIPPRIILYISTGMILLLAGGCIVGLMAGLWISRADQREANQALSLQRIIQLFAESFAESLFNKQGDSLQEEAFALVEMLSIRNQKVEDYHANDLRKDSLTYAIAFQKVVEVDVESLIGSLRMLETIFVNYTASIAAFGLGMADVVSTVSAWSSDDDLAFWRYVITNSTGTVYDSNGTCTAGSACNLNCVSDAMFTNATALANYTTIVANKSDVDPGTGLGSYSWALKLPSLNATVCAFLSNASYAKMRLKRIKRVTASGNIVPIGSTILESKDMVVATVPNISAPKVTWETPYLRYEDPCYALNRCNEVDAMVKNVSLTQITQVGYVAGYTNTVLLAAAAYSGDGIIVVLTEEFANVRKDSINGLVSIFDTIKSRTLRTFVSLSSYKDNGDIDADLGNLHVFTDQCMGKCVRFAEGQIAGRAALLSQKAGWVIQNDYRQKPVIAGYGYLTALNLGIVLERGIETIRNRTLFELVTILNDGNSHLSGSSETSIVRFVGMPPNRVFDPFEDCTHVEVCRPHFLEPTKYGIVYRSDCAGCSQRPQNLSGQIEYLTTTVGCWECGAHLDEIAIRPLIEQNAAPIDLIATDYRGKEVIAAYRYMDDFSIGIIVKIDRSEVRESIIKNILIAVAVAIVIIILGMIALILFSQRVLQRIEREWLSYKEKIDAEKTRFGVMVAHILPARISASLGAAGARSTALKDATLIFVDVGGFGTVVKEWEPGFVCKYMLYYQKLVVSATEHFGLDKIRFIGDTYFCVGGLTMDASVATNQRHTKSSKLREEREKKKQLQRHSSHSSEFSETETDRGNGSKVVPSILQSVNFAACLVQLCSSTYAHYPERVPDVQESFESHSATYGNQFPGMNSTDQGDSGSLALFPVRVGIHFGAATFTIIETDTTPSFDVFGPGVALAKRMETTSSPNFIHLTESAKEALAAVDTKRQFSFDTARRTAVKGVGTVTSYFLASADITVPAVLLSNFKIQQANWRVYHEEFSQVAPASQPRPQL